MRWQISNGIWEVVTKAGDASGSYMFDVSVSGLMKSLGVTAVLAAL